MKRPMHKYRKNATDISGKNARDLLKQWGVTNLSDLYKINGAGGYSPLEAITLPAGLSVVYHYEYWNDEKHEYEYNSYPNVIKSRDDVLMFVDVVDEQGNVIFSTGLEADRLVLVKHGHHHHIVFVEMSKYEETVKQGFVYSMTAKTGYYTSKYDITRNITQVTFIHLTENKDSFDVKFEYCEVLED